MAVIVPEPGRMRHLPWSQLSVGITALGFLLAADPPPACAQTQGATISGVVRSDAQRPLPGAVVLLDPSDTARRAVTDSSGRFRLTDVPVGAHILRILRLGYQPDKQSVDVPDGGVDLIIILERVTNLDTLHIVARRTGIFGIVVEHHSFKPLPGATVSILGANARATTASKGEFDLSRIAEGAYLVRVQHRGYASQMLSVVVPPDGGVEIAATLDPSLHAENDKRLGVALSEFEQRARFRGINSAIVARQELSGHLDYSVEDALRFSPTFLKSGLVVRDSITCVFVDGQPAPYATLNDFDARDVLAVEAYGLRADDTHTLSDRWPPGAQCGFGASTAPASSGKVGLQPGGVSSGRVPSAAMRNVATAVVIWLKK
jgi:hypothetical protein